MGSPGQAPLQRRCYMLMHDVGDDDGDDDDGDDDDDDDDDGDVFLYIWLDTYNLYVRYNRPSYCERVRLRLS